jgi:hypothetical protein
MEILKTGISPGKIRMHFTCQSCKSEFVEERSKCMTESSRNDTMYGHACPVCEAAYVWTTTVYGLVK